MVEMDPKYGCGVCGSGVVRNGTHYQCYNCGTGDVRESLSSGGLILLTESDQSEDQSESR